MNMINVNEFIAVFIAFAGILLMVYIIARYTYLIKKAMIEKGVYMQQKSNKFRYLDIGCIVFGLGVGLLVSSLYTTIDLGEDTMDLLIWGTILIFGAVGLVVAHFIRKKLEE